MRNTLPPTPATVISVSSTFRFSMSIVFKLAKMFGFWQRPYTKAATAFEEMSLLDKFYWLYKCDNPIKQSEKIRKNPDQFLTDSQIVKLPAGFEKQSSLTFGAAGDLFQVENLAHSKDIFFENISDLLFDQTISYANFESPLTAQEVKGEFFTDKNIPKEHCSRTQFDILKGYKNKNFTVLNTSNNHIFDWGVEGIKTTQRIFIEENILDTGTNSTPKEYGQGKILIREGIKIGFVSGTFGLNGKELPVAESYRVNVSKMLSKFAKPDLDILKNQIDHCKSQGCDFIIVSLHWGYEFEFFPRDHQVDIAHSLIEYGADAIIGHHPHVIQPVEYYRTQRDPNRLAVIAYSLGSLAWIFSAPQLVLSTILNLKITKGSFQNRNCTYIEAAKATPVFRDYIDGGGKIITRMEKLADHIARYGDSSQQSYIAEIKKYADLVLGKSELPNEQQTGASQLKKAA